MADAADRREARRKRILENSENRLRIISGLNKVGECSLLQGGEGYGRMFLTFNKLVTINYRYISTPVAEQFI